MLSIENNIVRLVIKKLL